MKNKILLLIGAVLFSAVLVSGVFYASGATKAGEGAKDIVSKGIPTDYEQQAKEYIVKKYGEPLDNLWVGNEINVSLPYSKTELWQCKMYGGNNYYGVVINKADNSISDSESYQQYLDAEEKAVKETCGKLNKYLYEKAINLKGNETVDVEILFNVPYSAEITALQDSIDQKYQQLYKQILKKYSDLTLKDGKPVDTSSRTYYDSQYYQFQKELRKTTSIQLADEREKSAMLRKEADQKFLQLLLKKMNSLGIKLIHEPDCVIYASVTKKQLKDIEALQEVSGIELFYGFPTAQ